MSADSRNGKKIPPGKLNIDTDAQLGAKLAHFVLVLIQKSDDDGDVDDGEDEDGDDDDNDDDADDDALMTLEKWRLQGS